MVIKMKRYAGIDIGGTNVKIGIIDENGKVYAKSSIKIADDLSVGNVVEKTSAELLRLIGETKVTISGVGVGIPGLIDSEKGLVVCSGNLDWTNENIVDEFKKFLPSPVKIGNDANVATLGEVLFGVGKNYGNCVMLTIGTGVGSGIVINGKIYAGKASAGAEIGHMIINVGGKPCTCGGFGCLEAYASATALKDETRKAMLDNPNSEMWEIGSPENVSGKTAFAYCETDETARGVVDNYVENLSVGIVNVANIFRPDAIILGGGVSYEGERLLKPLKEKLRSKIFAGDLGPKVELLLAMLRNDAGFMGAAALNFE